MAFAIVTSLVKKHDRSISIHGLYPPSFPKKKIGDPRKSIFARLLVMYTLLCTGKKETDISVFAVKALPHYIAMSSIFRTWPRSADLAP